MIFGTLSFPILCAQCEKSGAAAYTDGTVSSPYTSVTTAAAAAAAGGGGAAAAASRQCISHRTLSEHLLAAWRSG